ELRFHLFEAGNRLLPESKPFVAEYAERVLRRRGVEWQCATALQEIGPTCVCWAGGRVDSQTVVLAAGIVPSAVAASTNVARDRRRRMLPETTVRSASDAPVLR